jgi:hypothetical protein
VWVEYATLNDADKTAIEEGRRQGLAAELAELEREHYRVGLDVAAVAPSDVAAKGALEARRAELDATYGQVKGKLAALDAAKPGEAAAAASGG